MTACQRLTTGEVWQATILDRDFVETFSKSHFHGKYTFLMICYKVEVANNKMKVSLFYRLFKIGRNIIIPHKNHKTILQ